MNYIGKNIRWLLPLLIGAVGVGVALLLQLYAGLTHAQASKEGNTFWIVLGVLCSALIWAIDAYPTKVWILLYAAILGIVAGIICLYADTAIVRAWAGSDYRHLQFLDRTYYDRALTAFAITVPLALLAAMHRKLAAMKERFTHHAGAERLLRDAELFRLRQQLQPHFLYNSLNSINSLVIIDPDRAQEMVGRLSDFLRASVRKDNQEAVPVADELAYLDDYLAIEAVRFGDRLQLVYEKQYTDDARMPPFLLQPLIENAVKFGLYGHTGPVIITIRIYPEESYLVLQISNPYDPLMQPRKGTGFGLEGIRRRMYLLYGRDDLVQAAGSGHQFTTTLKIPQLHVPRTTH